MLQGKLVLKTGIATEIVYQAQLELKLPSEVLLLVEVEPVLILEGGKLLLIRHD